ncbi:MAG TPA: YetF domain-containing protein [Vicinamibacterales bacterium]|nr:YetF domain-containing protein [Vicinamibacterales bacterium]
MNPVFRAIVVFAVLWTVFRIGGRRTLAEITTFDFILLLVIGDAAQNALVGDDFSITTSAMVIVTLILLELGLDRVAMRSKTLRRVLDSGPVIVVDNGKVLERALRQEGLSVDEVLAAARERQGLERLDQIKYAIVEQHGAISIIPKEKGSGTDP